jgi:hypothetical protein
MLRICLPTGPAPVEAGLETKIASPPVPHRWKQVWKLKSIPPLRPPPFIPRSHRLPRRPPGRRGRRWGTGAARGLLLLVDKPVSTGAGTVLKKGTGSTTGCTCPYTRPLSVVVPVLFFSSPAGTRPIGCHRRRTRPAAARRVDLRRPPAGRERRLPNESKMVRAGGCFRASSSNAGSWPGPPMRTKMTSKDSPAISMVPSCQADSRINSSGDWPVPTAADRTVFIAGLLVGCPLPVALPRGNRKAVRERLVGVEVASNPGFCMPFTRDATRCFEEWSELALSPSIRFRRFFHGRPSPRVAGQSFHQRLSYS